MAPVAGGVASSASRITALDSVRGIAALAVVLHHCNLVLPKIGFAAWLAAPDAWSDLSSWLNYTPLRALINGRCAVILFFVLSGLVLTLPFLSGRQAGFSVFVARRFCRIYLPFAASILLSAQAYFLIRPVPIPDLTHWFNAETWSEAPNLSLVVRHLLMTGFGADGTLNNVMWSLVYEMRISIVFPVIAILTCRYGLRFLGAAFAVFMLTAAVTPYFASDTFVGTALATLFYALFFVVGSVMATRLDRLTDFVRPLRRRTIALIAVLAFGLAATPISLPFAELAYGVASVIVIALAVGHLRTARWLGHAACRWLGRVSYSLYLVHVPVIVGMIHLLDDRLPLAAILALALAVSLVAAEMFHRAFEGPSIRLGRWIGHPRARRAVQLV